MRRSILLLSVAVLLAGHLGIALDLLGEAGHCEDSCPSCAACGCCLHACPLPAVATQSLVEWRVAPATNAPRPVQGEPIEVLHVPRPDPTL